MAPRGSLQIGRLWSVPIRVGPGVLIMGVALVLVFAPRLDDAGYNQPWLLALVAVLSLYVSVLIHELAHVAAARRYEIAIQSVTLHLMGGETLLTRDSANPREEFVTAFSGPAASAILGLAGLAGGQLLGSGGAADVIVLLGWLNLLVAAVNLLPALPLDGGRALRAIIWAISGRERTGVVVTAWIGRVAAVVFVAVGVWLAITRRDEDGPATWINVILCLVVASFCWMGSSQALRLVSRADRIERLGVRRLFDDDRPEPGWPRLALDLHGSALLRALTAEPAEAYAVVDDQGHVVGTLRTHAVHRAYREGKTTPS